MTFPAGGGMEVTDNDRAVVFLDDVEHADEIFLGLAGDQTYEAGLILGRVTASGKLSPYISGQTDGTEIPVAILTKTITTNGTNDDIAIRAGVRGTFNERIVHSFAGGAGNGTTTIEKDQLRDHGMLSRRVDDFSVLDNR